MKIMIALHQVMDLGGIINHTEQLIGGLKDLGHQVDLKELVWKTHAQSQKKDGNYIVGPSGIPHNQGKGWNFTNMQRIAYRGGGGINTARQIMSEYDLIIWTVPVPSKNKENLFNTDWPYLYDLPSKVKQIAFIHDGNAMQGSSHIMMIQDKLSGIACVHSCALKGSNFLTVPRTLVLNPQHNPVRKVLDWNDRVNGFVNMQTFKAWKHVHELVQAIAYMPEKSEHEYREVIGRGIEYQYMTSEDKCKPEYFHEPSDKWFSGMKYWDAALGNGMVYHDYWTSVEVEERLQTAKVLVDPSWSNKYSAVGGHWNRVVVDAMIAGAVPVATSLGMGSELFKPGENYIAIPHGGVYPQHYADIIMEAGQMDENTARHFREANMEILPLFDRKRIAQKVIDLSDGSIDGPVHIGKTDPRIEAKFKDLMFNHFGVIV